MATDFETYKEYCKNRASRGLQVIPENLWNNLKKDV